MYSLLVAGFSTCMCELLVSLLACVRAGTYNIMHEGLVRVSERKYSYTVTCSLFLQYLIIFLMVTQHQRIGEFS